jgi:hypothetical protein
MNFRRCHDLYCIPGILRPGDVYLEIGAFRGNFFAESGYLLEQPEATFHLYEPMRLAVELLRQRFPPEVEIHDEAVWVREPVDFIWHDADQGQGNTLCMGIFQKSGQRVKTALPSTVMQRVGGKVRFLAMNAECAEYPILSDPAIRGVEFATVEFHPGKTGIDTVEFLRKNLAGWETMAFDRAGEPYNVWLGHNTEFEVR